MNEIRHQAEWRRWAWLGAAGALLFVLFQVLPATSDSSFRDQTEPVIAKREAERQASDFASRHFGAAPLSAHAVHQSDRLMYGYLMKEKLYEPFRHDYEARFPTDTYQATLRLPDRKTLFVHVHMTSGEIVGWRLFNDSLAEETAALEESKTLDMARAFAETRGFRAEELREGYVNRAGEAVLEPQGYRIGEARLRLVIGIGTTDKGQPVVTKYKAVFEVPERYQAYVAGQDRLASRLTLFGNLLISGVMAIVAAVIAVLYRKRISFGRGVVLTLLFLACYLVNQFNMADGMRASFGEDPRAELLYTGGMALTVVLTVLLGFAVYFSLVAGDGLWRAQGRGLWPKFGEAGFGAHVWQSMKMSYLFALILLGAQTVILFALERSTGAWSTSDPAQSPYNLRIVWLYPLLAWAAAISEEAVYRLFGIGLLRKWLRSTFAAALVPTVIWALGHVAYPIYPATTRLIELTVIGLAMSWLFLRYGFITAVFTHAIMNSILMAVSLVFLGSAANLATAAVYLALPVAVAWVLKRLHDKKSGRHPQFTVPPEAPR